MSEPSQNDPLLGLLQRQHQQLRQLDRVLWVVLPIMAFLLSVVCANFNWQSTLGTFVIMLVALCGVGIKHFNLAATIAGVALYAFVDNYYSYAQLDWPHLRLQLLTMLIFVTIVGIGRPYVNNWLLQKVR